MRLFKQRNFIFVLAFILCITIASNSVYALSTTSSSKGKVIKYSINLRKTASYKGSVITVIPVGAQVDIKKQYNKDWLQVTYKGKTGYAPSEYILIEKQPVTPTPPKEKIKYVNTTTLNVRSGPSTTYKILFSLNIRDKVTVTSEKSGWSYIKTSSGKKGWVSSKYLVDNLPARSNSDFVLLTKESNKFVIDLPYATKNNITKKVLYTKELAFLRYGTYKKLAKVNEDLMKQGYKLKIWDGYRPFSVQKKLWAAFPNASYIANPYTGGSYHNKGAAVDVTLVNMKTGKEVKMPTRFDEFISKCRRDKSSLWTAEEKKNVKILTDAMIKNGFTSITSEWWHYDDTEKKNYSTVDYSFDYLLNKFY